MGGHAFDRPQDRIIAGRVGSDDIDVEVAARAVVVVHVDQDRVAGDGERRIARPGRAEIPLVVPDGVQQGIGLRVAEPRFRARHRRRERARAHVRRFDVPAVELDRRKGGAHRADRRRAIAEVEGVLIETERAVDLIVQLGVGLRCRPPVVDVVGVHGDLEVPCPVGAAGSPGAPLLIAGTVVHRLDRVQDVGDVGRQEAVGHPEGQELCQIPHVSFPIDKDVAVAPHGGINAREEHLQQVQ